MAKIYFHKLAFSAPVKFKDANIRFESVGNNMGVKVIDDTDASLAEELAFLNDLADKKLRGVSRISEALYNEKKNNRASATSKSQQNAFGQIRIMEPRDSSPIKTSTPSAAVPAVPSVVESVTSAPKTHIPFVPEAAPATFTPNVRKRDASSASQG